MKKILKIKIYGNVGTGKTTFAQAIEKLCIDYGIESTVKESPDDGIESKFLNLSNLSQKIIVEIETFQTIRDLHEKP